MAWPRLGRRPTQPVTSSGERAFFSVVGATAATAANGVLSAQTLLVAVFAFHINCSYDARATRIKLTALRASRIATTGLVLRFWIDCGGPRVPLQAT